MRRKLGIFGLLLASFAVGGVSTASAQSWGNRGYGQGWNGGNRFHDYRDYDRGRRDWDRRDYERQRREWERQQRWQQRQWNDSRRFRDQYGSGYYNPYSPYGGYSGRPY